MIKYVVGDVRDHQREKEIVFIPHCCNDLHLMGSGVAKALYTKWPLVKEKYMSSPAVLGLTNYVKVDDGRTVVCNMIGQHGVKTGVDSFGCAIGDDGRPPVRYAYLAYAMLGVSDKLEMFGGRAEVHCPLFGCDLAGGDWHIISTLIEEVWCPLCPVTCVIHESSLGKFGYLLSGDQNEER